MTKYFNGGMLNHENTIRNNKNVFVNFRRVQNMKKTLFAITMAAFTAMSLAACGSGSGKTDTTAAAGTEGGKRSRGC